MFYNCSSPWFGPQCRFAFDPVTSISFESLVRLYFQSKSKITIGIRVSCYEHLPCRRSSSLCLDWREICDRKVDCLGGSDEVNCWQLEWNECAESEYRCHNGQCIPREFFYDVSIDPDCLDQTDEPRLSFYPDLCSRDPAFRCEEQPCRPRQEQFPCGDGRCSLMIDFTCQNGRDNLREDDLCSKAALCAMDFGGLIEDGWCEHFCADLESCLTEHCPSIIDMSHGLLFHHLHLFFENNGITIGDVTPSYVCYANEICGDLRLDIFLGNATTSCSRFDQLRLNSTNLCSSSARRHSRLSLE